MDFINPEGFLVESVESQCEAYQETEDEDENLLLFYLIQSLKFNPHRVTSFFGDAKNRDPKWK